VIYPNPFLQMPQILYIVEIQRLKAEMNIVPDYFLSGLSIQNRFTLFPDEVFPDKKIPINQHFLWHAQWSC
jgi:hypothetical protein